MFHRFCDRRRERRDADANRPLVLNSDREVRMEPQMAWIPQMRESVWRADA